MKFIGTARQTIWWIQKFSSYILAKGFCDRTFAKSEDFERQIKFFSSGDEVYEDFSVSICSKNALRKQLAFKNLTKIVMLLHLIIFFSQIIER